MRKKRFATLIFIVSASLLLTTGCWNYREVDQLEIVSGIAVDKGTNDLYEITVEIIKISGGQDSKITSETITMEGRTMFDTIRNGISLSGKRLYWSHAKVIILSKAIASEGVTKVLDWYNRDSETRADVHILISEEDSAKKILSGQSVIEEIKSFVLDDMIKNQKNLNKAPKINVLQFVNDLKNKGVSAIAPAVKLKQIDKKMVPNIMGTAIFNKDKLVGFLNGEETKDLIFIRNEVKGGVLVEVMKDNDITTPVSLEVFKSKTQVVPVVDGNDIIIYLNIDVTASIDEIAGTENYIDNEGRLALEQSAERTLKGRVESLVEKVQLEYGTDIFGFGAILRENETEEWKLVSDDWEDVFKNLKVDVTTKVHIQNSAILSKPLEEGE